MENYKTNFEETTKNIFKGIAIAMITTVVMLLIFSIILAYTNTSENTITPVIMVVTGISILIGSSIGSIKIKKNGIINGGLIGGIYILILYLISSILNWRFGLNIQSIIMIAVGMIFGILGGIIGVNKKWKMCPKMDKMSKRKRPHWTFWKKFPKIVDIFGNLI